jgi:transaldolase
VRGITSNPTIFAKAISGQDTYDDQFRTLMKDHTVESAYWEMAITDIRNALALLRPLYDESDGEDGFVSLEVSPALAHDTEGTVRDARDLHDAHRPAQPAGEGAGHQGGRPGDRDTDRRGAQHQRDADLRARPLRRGDGGLHQRPRGAGGRRPRGRAAPRGQRGLLLRQPGRHRGGPAPGDMAGGDKGDAAILGLRGTAAVAQAQTAYQHFHRTFAGERWEALRAKGARVQRPLWASTSTKNPGYPDCSTSTA